MPTFARKAGKKSSKTAAVDQDAAGPIKYAKRARKPFIWFNLQYRPLIAQVTGLKRFRPKLMDKAAKANSLEAAVLDAWRSLTPEQREPYIQMWRKDKERFQRELDSGMVEKPKKSALGEGDPLPPPRHFTNSYLFFQREHCKPGNSASDKPSKADLAKKWKALTPEERAPYKDLARQDVERWRTEMKEHNDKAAAGFGTVRKPPRKTYSAFLIFQRENKRSIEGGRGLDGKQLFAEAAQQWKALSPEERKKYEDLRDADKKRYQLEMDEYVAYTIRAKTASPNAIADFSRTPKCWAKRSRNAENQAGVSKPRKVAKRPAAKKMLALPAPPSMERTRDA
jgi:hypothetical protein